MKLSVPFVQLPVQFDAALLAAEMRALGETAWRPHPQKFPGNFALPLISVDGDPESDSVAGPMRSTPYLDACPGIRDVLAQLGAVWGRTRLMKLDPHAEVSLHADTNYYWCERVRVHIPILTQPDVRFMCGEAEVNMAPGECWIFDTWRPHKVVHANDRERVHLVADTVGSDPFWRLVSQGRVPARDGANWQPKQSQGAGSGAEARELLFESSNVPAVMTPWEMRYHLSFLLSETVPHPRCRVLEQMVGQFLAAWQALWAEFGESPEARPLYRAELETFVTAVRPLSERMLLVNGMEWMGTLRSMVQKYAVIREDVTGNAVPDEHLAGQASKPRFDVSVGDGGDPEFDRPVFIISSPRSGSTLLFETLQQAPGLYSTGSESHLLIESIPELHRAMSDSDSNCLDAKEATESVISELRRRFFARLRDRLGRRPTGGMVRMLEKTPKNALRIPFLAQAFPEARFVYLYRDPGQTLGSMMDAWQSGHFRTYPNLPGWRGLPWSLLLVPGWQTLVDKPLQEIVAAQWGFTTRRILDNLSALPADRCVALDYDDFVAEPQGNMLSLCKALGLDWDRSLNNALPASRYTLTAPDRDKWRKYREEIEAVLPGIQEETLLARAFLNAHAAPDAAI